MAQVPSASKNKIEDKANDLADRIEEAANTSGTATSGDVQADLEALRRDIAALTHALSHRSAAARSVRRARPRRNTWIPLASAS